jgi:hypothetical protein
MTSAEYLKLFVMFKIIACSIGPFFQNRDSDIGFYGSQDPAAGTGTERNLKFKKHIIS